MSISIRAQMGFYPVTSLLELKDLLMAHPQSIVFWDVDQDEKDSGPLPMKRVSQLLAEYTQPAKVFAISDRSFEELYHINSSSLFGHLVKRIYDAPMLDLFPCVALATTKSDLFGLDHYFSASQKIHRLSIQNARHKRAAVEAVSKVMEKLELPSRLATLIVQGTDELLLNGILDTLRKDNEEGKIGAEELLEFEVPKADSLQLEMAVTRRYLGIAVIDRAGSMQRDAVQGFLKKNFRKTNYEVKEKQFDGGLGLYGTVKAGLSVVFACRKNQRTQVALFAPVLQDYRAFKKSFRFFSFIVK